MGLGVRELFDNNIKVHFAGSDGGEIFYAALLAAQTKYRLFSCYKYILKCRPDDDFRLPADHVIRVQDTVNRHVIQDSGLFTLMFGAGKGQTQTLESLTEWQDKLIAFVQQNDLRCTCVELDCQKVLGVRISIHALREEGDPKPDHEWPGIHVISIHALREEGDQSFQFAMQTVK